MSPPLRRWLPATLLAMVVAAVLVVLVIGRGAVPRVSGAAVARPTPTLNSTDAVIAAVRNYYRVTDMARQNGNVDLVDMVTTDRDAPANVNFRTFMTQQTARGRGAAVQMEFFSDWHVTVDGLAASVTYTNWSMGHDIDRATGKPLEADVTTSKGRYASACRLQNSIWLVFDERLVQDNVH